MPGWSRPLSTVNDEDTVLSEMATAGCDRSDKLEDAQAGRFNEAPRSAVPHDSGQSRSGRLHHRRHTQQRIVELLVPFEAAVTFLVTIPGVPTRTARVIPAASESTPLTRAATAVRQRRLIRPARSPRPQGVTPPSPVPDPASEHRRCARATALPGSPGAPERPNPGVIESPLVLGPDPPAHVGEVRRMADETTVDLNDLGGDVASGV